MSKNVAVFVDVANLYYAARGQDVDVDYVALLKAATKGRDLIRAYAYSGLDPENENQRKFIDFLGKNGYKVVHKDIRKFGDGRVKANLDIELVVDLFRLADRMDIAVVVSGDGDFAPAIRALQDQGVRCEVISFRPNTSGDLIAVADEFIDIMKIASIGRDKAEKKTRVMSAPPMPAKEVVPEFGFREASPQVAAAALAAIKTGAPARGRAEARDAAETNGGQPRADGERRRRRRGGRGRGRGRRPTEAGEGAVAAQETPAEGEIGWEELDALPGAEEEREYQFSEADEETLRELGLSPDAAQRGEPEAQQTGADEAQAAAKPQRRRRTRRSEAPSDGAAEAGAEAGAAEPAAEPPAEATAATAEGEGAPEQPAKPRRRRTRKTAEAGDRTAKASGEEAAKDSAAPEATKGKRTSTRSRSRSAKDGGAGDKPKRTTRRRTASRGESAEQTGAGSEGETEGIWQRFRSGRERA